MAAFRAPGFVEGTFGLECLLDELAAKLELDPLELRRRNYADNDLRRRPAVLVEEPARVLPPRRAHWARRDEVRARSEGPWKRGIGLASQIWYGGGGPPSYAWVRVGSDGRAVVITAMQDIGTGTRTAMAQIAAEELGLPLERVRCELGDSARGPYASISAGSSTTPSMGPAVRAAAADAARQIVEIAAQRYDVEERVLSLKDGKIVSADGGSWPLEEVTGLLEDAQILGKGARGPNPTGMQVLTFGVQVAEVAVDVETGEVRVERIAAIHDVGRVINPLGAQSQVEGGIIQGIGHTLSEERLVDPASGRVLTQTLDAYKLPTIADVPEIVTELLDIPDEHLTNLGSKGLGEPPIVPTAAAIANAIRDATGADVRSLADHPRGDAARAARGRASARRSVQLLQPESLDAATAALGNGSVALAGGTELVPLLRDGLVEAETLVDVRGVVPRGVEGTTIGAGTTLAELEADPEIPAGAARGLHARGLAAAPHDGDDRRQPAAGDALLVLAAQLPVLPARRRSTCHAREGAHREHAIFGNEHCASAHPSDPAAALLALGATLRTDRRELPVAELYRLPTDDDRDVTDARAGRADPRARRAAAGGEHVPEGDGAQRAGRSRSSASPPRAAAARRASRSPAWRRSRGCSTGPDELDRATPLPGTAYKVELARPLVRRALEALG